MMLEDRLCYNTQKQTRRGGEWLADHFTPTSTPTRAGSTSTNILNAHHSCATTSLMCSYVNNYVLDKQIITFLDFKLEKQSKFIHFHFKCYWNKILQSVWKISAGFHYVTGISLKVSIRFLTASISFFFLTC